jgi:hypothetical protein
MPSKFKSSSNQGMHPYLKGFAFWNANRFWNDGRVTKSGVKYFDASIEQMRINEMQRRRSGSTTRVNIKES